MGVAGEVNFYIYIRPCFGNCNVIYLFKVSGSDMI